MSIYYSNRPRINLLQQAFTPHTSSLPVPTHSPPSASPRRHGTRSHTGTRDAAPAREYRRPPSAYYDDSCRYRAGGEDDDDNYYAQKRRRETSPEIRATSASPRPDRRRARLDDVSRVNAAVDPVVHGATAKAQVLGLSRSGSPLNARNLSKTPESACRWPRPRSRSVVLPSIERDDAVPRALVADAAPADVFDRLYADTYGSVSQHTRSPTPSPPTRTHSEGLEDRSYYARATQDGHEGPDKRGTSDEEARGRRDRHPTRRRLQSAPRLERSSSASPHAVRPPSRHGRRQSTVAYADSPTAECDKRYDHHSYIVDDGRHGIAQEGKQRWPEDYAYRRQVRNRYGPTTAGPSSSSSTRRARGEPEGRGFPFDVGDGEFGVREQREYPDGDGRRGRVSETGPGGRLRSQGRAVGRSVSFSVGRHVVMYDC